MVRSLARASVLTLLGAAASVRALAAPAPPRQKPAAPPAAAPAAPALPFKAGFDEARPPALPAGWTVEGTTQGRVSVDREVKRTGAASLHVASAAPGSVTVAGPALRLEVGKVYRLSGFIRTKGAVSDPTGRYPTPVPAALTMASFPFTNHSPAVGGTRDFTKVETLFVATASDDAVKLHLGLNGTATGEAWFDDVEVSEVADVTEMIPLETVRWHGPAFRYDEKGWIFVHVEGEPYARGFQYGTLVSEEIAEYIRKLGVQESPKDPQGAWAQGRLLTDTVMLRKYDEEYLAEMKGIADGAAKAGAKVDGRAVDLLDIVTANSWIDLRQLPEALRTTPNALTGRNFLSAEDEMKVPDQRHKCSAFAANGPATKDGRIVFGQIFMWAGYTGVHFNVICDVVPSKGHRLVYQTFPGGIHSGTDFYMNDAGILIGETTVAQTPWNVDGTPQSNRIRRAAQYASSIDDVVRTLREKNNGMYTNDWPIADVKTNEIAMYLLGTSRDKLWRSKEDPNAFGTPGFYWANNNARDPGVRMEYAVQPDDAPFDLVFQPWNRDLAFRAFYEKDKGRFDAIAAVNMWASSPINRPHACDGKVTTSEMAEKLVFLAHFGKVTLREKFPQAGSRRMPDHPGAIPHLTLGYTAFSPVFVAERLKEAHAKAAKTKAPAKDPALDAKEVEARYKVDHEKLWKGTVAPASDGDNWLVSGSAAYWQMLHGLPSDGEKAARAQRDQLGALNARAQLLASREGDLAARDARRVYDRYGPYFIPRIKGTFALHQLRLLLGNGAFLGEMSEFFAAHRGKPVTTNAFVSAVSQGSGRDVGPFLAPWVERTGFPEVRPRTSVVKADDGWLVKVDAVQIGEPYHLLGSVAIEAGGKRLLRPFELKGPATALEWKVAERPTRVVFNAGHDFPMALASPFTWASLLDDFSTARIVHGTARQIEAARTLALRYQTAVADAYTEDLLPVRKDCEVTDEELAGSDLVLLGPPSDNTLTARVAEKLPVTFGKGFFVFQGRTYARPDDGIALVVASPWNAKKALFVVAGNGALELHEMTKDWRSGLPQWAVFRGAEVKEQGLLPVPGMVFEVPAE